MKKITVKPEKARVKGNILSNFGEVLEKTSFEDFHVKHDLMNTFTWKNTEKQIIRLNPKAEKLYMTLTASPTSIEPRTGISTLNIHLYYKNRQNEDIPVSSQTIYIYDGKNLIGNTVSNSTGDATYEFSSAIQGIHELTIKTLHSNGFDGVSKKINISVYITPTLVLTPRVLDIEHGSVYTLTALMRDNNGVAVSGKDITFYEGVRKLGTSKTNSKGIATYRYLESDNRGVATVIELYNSNIVLRHNTETEIHGVLRTIDGNPIPNKMVQLFKGNSAYKRTQATTRQNGEFIIKYTPEDDNTYNYYLVFMSTIENQQTNEYITYEPCIYDLGELEVRKALGAVTGLNATGVKDEGVSWGVIVPKDYNGDIYAYQINEWGRFQYGNAGDSMLSTTKDCSDVTVTDYDENRVKITWENNWVNRKAANTLKTKVGTFSIVYRLYNDTHYDETSYSTQNTLQMRQPAVITINAPRTLETKETTIEGTAYDVTGNPMNSSLTISYNNKHITVPVTDGRFSTQMMPEDRSYNISKNHVTPITAKYTYAESGYWSKLNATVNTYSYNIKNNQSGIFINGSPTFNLSAANELINNEIFDWYVRANQEGDLSLIKNIISLLNTNNLRSSVRIHAVFNCFRATDGTWYLEDDKLSNSRIESLKNHIDELLSLDIEGLCLDYIRRADTTPKSYTESDVTNALTVLTNYIKSKTEGKTILISSCVMPDVSSSTSVYGQNYNIFTRRCDYIIPMLYLYDYSTVNTSEPVKSKGYAWQQEVLEGIHEISGKDNVFPAITTYHGDSHTSTSCTTEEYTNQILSMWNYGVPEKYLQRSIIYFRYGLIGTYPPKRSVLTSALEDYYQNTDMTALEYGALINNKSEGKNVTYDLSDDALYLTLKTKWGASLSPLYTYDAILKINGETVKTGDNELLVLSESEYQNYKISNITYPILRPDRTYTLELVVEGKPGRRIVAYRGAWILEVVDEQ